MSGIFQFNQIMVTETMGQTRADEEEYLHSDAKSSISISSAL